MENKITCPMCYAEKMCLEETQADFSSYMCFRCGYMSDSRFTEDSEYLKMHQHQCFLKLEDIMLQPLALH